MHRPTDLLSRRRRRNDCGAVTAEAALVLPLLAVVAMALAWMIALGVTAVRVQDAAREAARVVARGDPVARGETYARRVAPSGASVSIHAGTDSVVVKVTAHVHPPGGILDFIPAFAVRGRAVAAAETGSP
ncbi:MAG TPA: TadE family type IV pilus minor pilin [Marmoricola sp.]